MIALLGEWALTGLGDIKALGRWLGGLNGYQLLAIGLALFALEQHVALVFAHRHATKVEAQLASTSSALSDARGALQQSAANETALRSSLAAQSAAVSKMATDRANDQAVAQRQIDKNAGLVAEAQATTAEAKRSASSRPAPGAPCEPSSFMKEAWR